MSANPLFILAALLGLISATAVARHFASTTKLRNALSVILVVVAMLTAFYFCFSAGSWIREHRAPATARTAQA